ncbi:MAG TPA: bifunctional UDP-sugar hydrolase/5'-nucleotidase, partial [Candidatus Ozemobacteraceae bacterium]|nr:bifunctional UDP-sugar hydrolase/5'-nucleotidase [Candidatus Ozemobacteraceae bacterium]
YKLRALSQGIRWLQVDAGDRFQGTMEVNFSHGQAMTDLYNALHYTAVTLGNHDFDYGKQALTDSMKSARFPLVCANLIGIGMPWHSRLIAHVGSLTIGITGVMTSDLPTLTYPENIEGLILENPASAARRVTAELRKRGCDLVILLSHCGHDVDQELARAVPDLDIIIGGHSDEHLNQPEKIGKTLIMQTRGYGSHVGALTLIRDEHSGSISSYTYDSIALDPASWTASPEIDPIIASWGRMVDEIAARPVGESPREFFRRPGPDGESLLGIQLCKAVSAQSGCPIVLFQLGGLRTDLPAGKIVFKDIYQVLPFNHQILVGTILGRDLLSLLDKGSDKKGVELCILGPKLKRGAEGFAAEFEGKPVLPDARYPIALNDFLAKGGDGFEEFTRVENLHPQGGIIRDALLEWIRKGNLGS